MITIYSKVQLNKIHPIIKFGNSFIYITNFISNKLYDNIFGFAFVEQIKIIYDKELVQEYQKGINKLNKYSSEYSIRLFDEEDNTEKVLLVNISYKKYINNEYVNDFLVKPFKFEISLFEENEFNSELFWNWFNKYLNYEKQQKVYYKGKDLISIVENWDDFEDEIDLVFKREIINILKNNPEEIFHIGDIKNRRIIPTFRRDSVDLYIKNYEEQYSNEYLPFLREDLY